MHPSLNTTGKMVTMADNEKAKELDSSCLFSQAVSPSYTSQVDEAQDRK